MRRATVALIMIAASVVSACGVDAFVLLDRTPSPDAGNDSSDGGTDTSPPLGDGTSVVTGEYHSCAIRAGALACWGQNTGGQLGVGDLLAHDAPTASALKLTWSEIGGGEQHGCGLEAGSGAVWCWGDAEHGQTGLGDTTRRPVPQRVTLRARATRVELGFNHTCAILADSTLWCWGDDTEGQLGQNSSPSNALMPIQVGTADDWRDVAGGQGHTCGIRGTGTLWCFGRNTAGELGLGAGSPGQVRVATQVGTADGFRTIDCGQDASCGLRSDGTLWCWGDNSFGQLGFPPSPMQPAPKQIGADSDWTDVSIGTFSACARKTDRSIWCWGRNAEGQLGLGDTADRTTPTKIGTGSWKAIAAGRFHTCALSDDGTVWCAGENAAGQLGVGDRARRNALTKTLP